MNMYQEHNQYPFNFIFELILNRPMNMDQEHNQYPFNFIFELIFKLLKFAIEQLQMQTRLLDCRLHIPQL